MSGVSPQSTTSGLAGKVPKEMEHTGSSDLPGSFPETPAFEAAGFNVGARSKETEDLPGSFPEEPAFEAADSNVGAGSKETDNSQQTFGVAPLLATVGIGNPVRTQPGEKVPHPSTFANNTIKSAVTTDKESYDKSGGPPQLPDVVTPQKERDARGGMFGLLPDSLKNLIPESSLPMGGSSAEKDPGYTTQSAGPQSSTAELAGKVPLESDGSRNVTSIVPDIVQESRAKAGFAPEAGANKEAVIEKSEVEKELESKIPEEPATTEGTGHANGGTTDKAQSSKGDSAGMVAGAAGATAAVAAAAGSALQATASKAASLLPTRGLPPSVQQSIDEMNKGTPIDPYVPDVVQESITKAHVAPEAAASSEMVQEKSAMESELLKKVHKKDSQTSEAASSLPTRGLPPSVQQSIGEMNKGTAIDPHVPDVVQESIAKAHVTPEAAASSEMVQEKSAMEEELLRRVREDESSGEPAPALASALFESAPAPTSKSATSAAAAAVTETPPAAPAKDFAPTTAPAPISKDVNSTPSAAAPSPAPLKSTETPLPMKSTETPLSNAGLAAPAAAPAMTAASKPGFDSRDVSPMSRPVGASSQQEPIVTTGVGSSTTPVKSTPVPSAVMDSTSVASSSAASTPQKTAAAPSSPMSAHTGESSASGEQKKKHRASGFFGKLKSRFEHKDKK